MLKGWGYLAPKHARKRGGDGGGGEPVPDAEQDDQSPSLISLMVSVDVKHHVYLLTIRATTTTTKRQLRERCVPVGRLIHVESLARMSSSMSPTEYRKVLTCFVSSKPVLKALAPFWPAFAGLAIKGLGDWELDATNCGFTCTCILSSRLLLLICHFCVGSGAAATRW